MILLKKFLPNAKAEVKVGNSRIDFQDGNTFIEVKGCSLVENGVAMFPDAPTERGRRHLEELIKLKEKGYILHQTLKDKTPPWRPTLRSRVTCRPEINLVF